MVILLKFSKVRVAWMPADREEPESEAYFGTRGHEILFVSFSDPQGGPGFGLGPRAGEGWLFCFVGPSKSYHMRSSSDSGRQGASFSPFVGALGRPTAPSLRLIKTV